MREFDLAILDVNLKGESVWPVATALREKGTPFVLASGGHVDPPPAEFANVPMIEKPYTIDRVTPIIEAALRRTRRDRTLPPSCSLLALGWRLRCGAPADHEAVSRTEILFPTHAVPAAGPLAAGAERLEIETAGR